MLLVTIALAVVVAGCVVGLILVRRRESTPDRPDWTPGELAALPHIPPERPINEQAAEERGER